MKLKIGSKSKLRYFNYKIIKDWNPCYNPIKYISKNWKGTAIDILKMDNIPFQDRLWCVLHTEIVSEKVMRLFAVWSYRDTLNWIKNPDPRSIEAANVAERFALGKATQEELSAARSAARSVESAARSAARSAAWGAARSAARSVESAARSAESAARSAARSAAWSAARSAARSATWSAAWSAAETRQKDKLIEMILCEAKERKNI